MKIDNKFIFLLLSLIFMISPPSSIVVSASSTTTFIELTDDTFEHETQASTGMTTGSWLIFVHTETCVYCESLRMELEMLKENYDLEEMGIVLGALDAVVHHATAVRFNIKHIPSLLYLHKGYLYKFDKPRNERTMDNIYKFITQHEELGERHHMPPPPSTIATLSQAVDDMFHAIEGRKGMVGMAMTALFSTLILTIIILIYVLMKMPKVKAE